MRQPRTRSPKASGLIAWVLALSSLNLSFLICSIGLQGQPSFSHNRHWKPRLREVAILWEPTGLKRIK